MSQPPAEVPKHILKLFESVDKKEKRRSPLRDPQDPAHWWRVLPNANSPWHSMPLGTIWDRPPNLSPRQAVNIAMHHLEALGNLGIVSSNVQMYLGEGGPHGTRLFSRDEHVTGVTGKQFSKDHHLLPMFRLIGSHLLDYANWVQDTRQKFFLFDIARPDQYMYGTTVTLLHDEAILIDTDPFLAHATATQINDFRDRADRMRHK